MIVYTKEPANAEAEIVQIETKAEVTALENKEAKDPSIKEGYEDADIFIETITVSIVNTDAVDQDEEEGVKLDIPEDEGP